MSKKKNSCCVLSRQNCLTNCFGFTAADFIIYTEAEEWVGGVGGGGGGERKVKLLLKQNSLCCLHKTGF